MNVVYQNTKIPIQTFFLDSPELLRNRIAEQFNTLPEYIILKPLSDTEQELVHLWDMCRENNNISQLLDMKLFPAKDVILLWALQYRQLYSYLLLDDNFTKTYKDDITPLESLNRLQEELNKRLNNFRKDQKKVRDILKYIENIPTYELPPIHTENVLQQIPFTAEKDTLESVFNELHTSDSIPMILYNDYYKVREGFVPPVNWKPAEDAIVCKYRLDEEKYLTLHLRKEKEEFVLEMEKNPDVDTDEVMRTLLQSIASVQMRDTRQNNTGGYLTTELTVDNNVFADILFTFPHFSTFLSVNDNIKHPGKFGSRVLYFHNPYTEDFVVVSMARRISTDDTLYPLNTPYVRVKILRTSSNTAIDVFTQLFSKILTVYQDHSASIEQYYSKYIIDDEKIDTIVPLGRKRREEMPEPRRKNVFLKDMIPAVFQSRVQDEIYTRKCQGDNKQPVIKTEQELARYEGEWLQFPKERDAHIATPQYYVCPHPEYKYPGLIRFQNELGFAPCCFKRPQTEKPIYLEYYENKEVETAPQAVYFKRSDKIIQDNDFGYLPRSGGKIVNHISLFFERLNVPYLIVRQGVRYSPHSVLECILQALQVEPFTRLSRAEKDQYLVEERRKLAPYAALAKQEMYDMNVAEIEAYLESEEHLSPEKTIRILEHVYQCNLLLFYKTDSFGEIRVPPHAQMYCQTVRDDTLPTLFLYTHMGSETDYLRHPHCELLIHLRPEEEKQLRRQMDTSLLRSTWVSSDEGYAFCWKVYDTLATYFVKQNRLHPIPKELPKALRLQRQYIDAYGKVRRVELVYKSQTYIVETSPLPPLNLPLLDEKETPTLLPLSLIVRLMSTLKLQQPTSYDIHGHTQYMEGWLSHWCTLRFYVQSEHQYIYPTDTSSAYTEFLEQHKLARCLTNWYFYLFSEFLHQKTIAKATLQDIQRFHEQTTRIIPNHTYDARRIPDTFTERETNTLFRNGQLVCTSEELARKLLYQLRLVYERNRTNILQYRTKRNLENYYLTEHDFTTHPKEYILYIDPSSPHRLTDLLQGDTTTAHTLYRTLQPSLTTPYYFKHPTITENRIALVQNCSTLEKAVQTVKFWKEHAYNAVQEEFQYRDTFPYYLYTLTPNQEASLYQVRAGFAEPDMKVVTDKNVYGSVLTLQ